MLIIIAAGEHLLAGGSQEDGVLVLRYVASLLVAERRVGLHDAHLAQVLQRHEVLLLAGAVEPPSAEGEGVELLCYVREKSLCARKPARGRGKHTTK